MPGTIEYRSNCIDAMRLHPDMKHRFLTMLGLVSTTAHAMGLSLSEDSELVELVIEFVAECRGVNLADVPVDTFVNVLVGMGDHEDEVDAYDPERDGIDIGLCLARREREREFDASEQNEYATAIAAFTPTPKVIERHEFVPDALTIDTCDPSNGDDFMAWIMKD